MNRGWEQGKWKMVGNRCWEQRLATYIGKKRKGTRNKEQGLKTGAGNKD